MITDEEVLADADRNPALGHNALANISALIAEHQDVARRLADLTDQAKELSQALTHLELTTIPDAMLAAGCETVSTPDGTSVSVAPIVTGSIPKKNMPEAAEWLRGHGHGDIIKRDVTVTFSKEQDALAEKLCGDLVAQGYAPVSNESVHASTLKSWAKERIEAGDDLPLDLLGLFHGRRAKIVLPKSPKKT